MVIRREEHTIDIYCDYNMFKAGVERIIDMIKKSGKKYDRIVGFPRGGLTIALTLSHHLGLPMVVPYFFGGQKGEDYTRFYKIEYPLTTIICDDTAGRGDTFAPYPENDKYVLFATDRAMERVPNIYPAFKFTNEHWVTFFWENLR